MRKLIIPLTFLILGSGLQAQTTIWPGDVNNNGVVNNIDIIYWAYGKNTEGPARSNISTGWEEQSLDTLWATEFTDGTNLAFADCNGDGKVDEKDLQVIKDNFNFCRPIASGEYIQKADASCDSILFYQPVLADTTDNEQPKTDELFGAAFTFQFDPDVWAEKGLVSCNQITVDSVNHENWLSPTSSRHYKIKAQIDENAGNVRAKIFLRKPEIDSSEENSGPIQIVMVDIVLLSEEPSSSLVEQPKKIKSAQEKNLRVNAEEIVAVLDGSPSISPKPSYEPKIGVHSSSDDQFQIQIHQDSKDPEKEKSCNIFEQLLYADGDKLNVPLSRFLPDLVFFRIQNTENQCK